MIFPTIPAQFDMRIYYEASTWHWLWTGVIDKKTGYGKCHVPGTANAQTSIHRYIYELLVGAIPKGYTIDHLCRIRHCCAPQHLEAVPQKVNGNRGTGPQAVNAAKTHCNKGHEFTPENTHYIANRNERVCKECGRSRARKHWQNKGAEQYQDNREDKRAYNRQYYQAHREMLKARSHDNYASKVAKEKRP